MTVSQMIDKLQKMPQDVKVLIALDGAYADANVVNQYDNGDVRIAYR